jgi:hypothetical protein
MGLPSQSAEVSLVQLHSTTSGLVLSVYSHVSFPYSLQLNCTWYLQGAFTGQTARATGLVESNVAAFNHVEAHCRNGENLTLFPALNQDNALHILIPDFFKIPV